MYEKRLWKPIMAGTLALTMFLTPMGSGGVIVFAEEAEILSETVMEEGVDNAEADIVLDEAHFPDENFRTYLSDSVDEDKNNIISKAERDACTVIVVNDKNIKSLTGIEYFTELTYLSCEKNSLTSLDMRGNPKLTELRCYKNSLTSLDISGNPELTALRCYDNSLTSLDISMNTKLTNIECENNALTSLDVSTNEALQYLWCSANSLTSLDVSTNEALKRLECSANSLTSLVIRGNEELTILNCSNNALTSLDVSGSPKLSYLYCSNNALTSLNVSGNEALYFLECENNALTSLDVSANLELNSLYCDSNALTSLDVNTNTNLKKFSCTDNIYYAKLDTERKYELSKLPSFNYTKVLSVSGGTFSATELSFHADSDAVAYTYDCGNSWSISCTIKEFKAVQTIALDKSTANVLKGETLQLNATVAPEDATDKSVTWTTSDSSIATVSEDGLVTAQSGGTATITCNAKDGSGVKATCVVTVKSLVTKVALNKTKASVFKGKTVQLKATITPSDATDKSVTWKSSNTKVATVSTSGKVTAKAVGTATITCTAKDGSGVKATCKITVTNPVTKVKLNQTQASLSPKETLTLKATVTPSNATNKAVTWKSSNTKVATVSSSGKVTAKAAGTATITCTAKDGSGKKATGKITVYTNTEAFVARIYTKALSRTPEEAGLKYWTDEINSGRKTPVEVAESFFFAPEFTNKNLSNTEYVKVLYRTFMGREYDTAGLNYWVGRLNKGESRKSVLESFAGCQEFKDIVKSFGL